MNIKVYVKQPSGPPSEVVLKDVDAAVYEKSNHNNGKPDLLTIQNHVKASDWEEYEVVAEFHVSDIAGWVSTEHLGT